MRSYKATRPGLLSKECGLQSHFDIQVARILILKVYMGAMCPAFSVRQVHFFIGQNVKRCTGTILDHTLVIKAERVERLRFWIMQRKNRRYMDFKSLGIVAKSALKLERICASKVGYSKSIKSQVGKLWLATNLRVG